MRQIVLTVLFACAVGWATASAAATQLRKPLIEDEKEEPVAAASAPAARSTSRYVGQIIYTRGSQVVAEIPGGAKEKERLILFDGRLHRSGSAVVARALDKATYLLHVLGSGASVGDRLTRETEAEAVLRVLEEDRLEAYQEFLDLFPSSAHRPRVAREMFRLTVQKGYPAVAGLAVAGRLKLLERTSRTVPLANADIVLDRFVLGRTTEDGSFRIEGIPRLPQEADVRVRVNDRRFQMAEELRVKLPAESYAEVSVEVPVQFTPTTLEGRVVDHQGEPLPGSEVWTSPYTMEALTDETGAYRISRRKVPEAAGGEPREEPMFGGEYEVYARRPGYSVERVRLSAESFQPNGVPPLRLVARDLRAEEPPGLQVDLRAHLGRAPEVLAAPQGASPRLNP